MQGCRQIRASPPHPQVADPSSFPQPPRLLSPSLPIDPPSLPRVPSPLPVALPPRRAIPASTPFTHLPPSCIAAVGVGRSPLGRGRRPHLPLLLVLTLITISTIQPAATCVGHDRRHWRFTSPSKADYRGRPRRAALPFCGALIYIGQRGERDDGSPVLQLGCSSLVTGAQHPLQFEGNAICPLLHLFFSSFVCSSALSFLVLAMHYYTLRDRCQHGVARLPRPAPSNILPEETVKDHGGLPCHLRGHKTLHNSVDEALLLKRKSEEVLFYLNERWFATAAE